MPAIRHYAVMYPSSELTTINNAMQVIECETTDEVCALLSEWRAQFPSRRHVYRREETQELQAEVKL